MVVHSPERERTREEGAGCGLSGEPCSVGGRGPEAGDHPPACPLSKHAPLGPVRSPAVTLFLRVSAVPPRPMAPCWPLLFIFNNNAKPLPTQRFKPERKGTFLIMLMAPQKEFLFSLSNYPEGQDSED